MSLRARALLLVGSGLLLLEGRVSEPAGGESVLALMTLPIGYGHLLGGWLFAPKRVERGGLEQAFRLVSVLTLLCVYTWILHVETLRFAVLAPMLLASGWHIVENDLALGRASREGTQLQPISRAGTPHALALAVTALLGLAALATPEGAYHLRRHLGTAPPLQLTGLPFLATAVLMYHAAAFVLFTLDRARTLPAAEGRRLRRKLFWVHALPLAASLLLVLTLPRVHFYVAAPTLYLFFSVLHVFQTAARRGLEPRRQLRMAMQGAR